MQVVLNQIALTPNPVAFGPPSEPKLASAAVEFGWQNYQRKISAVMMLTGPDEYEGGELEVCNNGNFEDIQILKPNKGDIVFFASWMPHRVKPVTSGERKSLVMWVMGKRQS
jgi:predicted 2-oxoglutarate/Fe(II)-dependent dioxygenase YbiX